MKKRSHNPFIFFFSSFAIISFFLISFAFFFIIYKSKKETQSTYFQEKTRSMLNDFEQQLDNLESLSLRFSINHHFSYSFLEQHIYNELVLLEDLTAYQDYFVLEKDFYIYYHDYDAYNVFHTNGKKMRLDIILDTLSYEESKTLKNTLLNYPKKMELYAFSDSLYVLLPFNTLDIPNKKKGILGIQIAYSELYDRFKSIAGNLNGNISLYTGNKLLFSNQENPCARNEKNVYSIDTDDKRFTLCYLPDKKHVSYINMLQQSFFLLADVFLLLILVRFFATSAYRPILHIRQKYTDKEIPLNNLDCKNAFEEIEYIITNTLQNNVQANIQIQQMQDTLKQQILRLLLNGVYSQDIQAYLKRLDISLPGPFYYVLSIAFLQEKESGRLQNIKKELDQLILENPAEHIYTLHDITQKQLWVICSLAAKENEPEMTEYIVSIAQCYSIEPAIGIGRVYTSLSRISTSWLESIDNLTRIKKQTNKEHTTYVFNLNDLHWLEDFLSIGDKTATLNALTQFVNQLEKDIPSLIMLQYIFTEFIGEISRLGKRRGIELSSSSISLLISSKTIDEFHRAANEIIHDYFEKLSHQREQKNENEAALIFQYMNEHFSEYSLSIEQISVALNLSTATIRETILQVSGVKYKDYLLALRIEYAKQLLSEGHLSVADICTKVGYSSVSYFITAFKESTGVTPAKYMKSIQ